MSALQPIYVGDAGHLRRRLHQHCGGNVEASALRKHVAVALGYSLVRTTRASGSTRVRIGPDPEAGEAAVSAYLGGGSWQVVVCASAEEARAFQWFAIEALCPLLNRDLRAWDEAQRDRFASLLRMLSEAPPLRCGDRSAPDAPGVYLLRHAHPPAAP